MVRRPPRSSLMKPSSPTRRSSDLGCLRASEAVAEDAHTGRLRVARYRDMTVASLQRPPRSTWMCRCCGLITLEDQCRVGAAKSERIAQHPAHALVACRVWHEKIGRAHV